MLSTTTLVSRKQSAMKASEQYLKKITSIIMVLSIAIFFQACNPNEDTGENLVGSDIGDNSPLEIDIYVLNENTLYGLRDNNSPSINGIGTIEPFLTERIPGYVSSSSPVLYRNNEGNEDEENEGSYTDVGLLVSSTDGILYNYNIPSNDLLWQTDLGGTCSATPSRRFFNNGTEGHFTCVGTNNGQLHFIDINSGEIYATYSNLNGAGFDSKVIFYNSKIIAGSADGSIYSIREDGTFLQSYDTGAPILTGPLIDYNPTSAKYEVFVGNRDGQLFKLTDDLSELHWNIQLTGSIYAEPIGAIDGIYVTTTDGRVYKINKDTGVIDWEFQAEGPIYSPINYESATEPDNLLYFTSTDGSVYALNQSGILQWKTDLGDGALFCTPALAYRTDDLLYVNTINGVYGLNADTGEVFSNFSVTHSPNADVSGNFKSSPAVFVLFNNE